MLQVLHSYLGFYEKSKRRDDSFPLGTFFLCRRQASGVDGVISRQNWKFSMFHCTSIERVQKYD